MTNTFAERLRWRTAQFGLSARQVALRAKIGERAYGHYLTPRSATGELSEPDFAALLRICNVLHTHPNWLLGYSDDPEPPGSPGRTPHRGIADVLAELEDLLVERVRARVGGRDIARDVLEEGGS